MWIHSILRGLLPWVKQENLPNWFRGFPVTGPDRPPAAALHAPFSFTPVASPFLTCEPARRLSVASPPLQEKEVVASLRHPELQGVFQENFLRVQPHIFPPEGEGPGGIPARRRSLQRGALGSSVGACGPVGAHSGEFAAVSMLLLPRRRLQLSDFLASFPHGRFTAAARTGTRSSKNQDASL